MQKDATKVVVLGTGGTIAGLRSAQEHGGYRAGQLGVERLLAQLPAAAAVDVETRQLAQIDSKDADAAFWQLLATGVAAQLARAEVRAVVVTHGSDTLEESAYLLHRVLAPAKPVVFTAAMRPADAAQADGPRNLADALTLATTPAATGVLVLMAGSVHAAPGLRKLHLHRLDPLDSVDAGPLGRIADGRFIAQRPWPAGAALGLRAIERPAADWPRVAIVLSHAGADGSVVDALLAQSPAQRVAGLIAAGTGSGTLHAGLEAALRRAQQAGVVVRRSSRCGGVVGDSADALPAAQAATPVQARIDLLLELLMRSGGTRG